MTPPRELREEWFRELAERSGRVFWIVSPDYTTTFYVSRAYEEVWGRPCQALYEGPADWVEAIHPDDRDRVVSARRAGAQSADWHFIEEYRIRRPDGGVRWILDRGVPITNAEGRLTCISGIAEDVTASKNAERQLQAKTKLLAAVAEALSTFLERRDWRASSSLILRAAINQTESEHAFLGIVVGRDGKRGLEIVAHEERGRGGSLTPPNGEGPGAAQDSWKSEVKGNFATLLGSVITGASAVISNNPSTDPRSGRVPPGQTQLQTFLGVPVFRRATAIGLIGVANRRGGYSNKEQQSVETLAGAAGVVYDSWFQQQREAELRRAYREAEESASRRQAELEHVLRLATVGEMAAGLAHEINQPLAAISNFLGAGLQFIKSGHADLGAVKEPLEQATRETRRAGAIIRRLGNLARRRAPHLESDDLNQILQSIGPLLGMEAERRGVTLRIEPAPEWLPVRADRVQVEQVILNLVRNALEAIANTTRVGEVQIRTTKTEDGMAELAVCDTGAGISSAIADRMFDAFFTTKPEGLGMGLTISGFIMEAHGGRLLVASNPNGGATAQFTLPLRQKDYSDGT